MGACIVRFGSYLKWSIGAAGPTAIKMAQWAATRDDLFPEPMCIKLAELQEAGACVATSV